MKKVGAVAPAVLISRFGVTLARSATLCAPRAFSASASNCVTDAAISDSMSLASRSPSTRITSTPAGIPVSGALIWRLLGQLVRLRLLRSASSC